MKEEEVKTKKSAKVPVLLGMRLYLQSDVRAQVTVAWVGNIGNNECCGVKKEVRKEAFGFFPFSESF